jgi:hypothetical protein
VFVSLFTVLRLVQEFLHLFGYVTIVGEGLQNLGLYLALRAFEQGGNFIMPHLLCFFPVSSDEPPHSVASYNTQGVVEEGLF